MKLDAFRGSWRIARVIDDVRDGRGARFEGIAWFEPAEGGLDYREEGQLALEGGASFAATRRYLWRENAAGSIEVRFADGRFFHRFRSDESRPVAFHDCPPDQYRVAYDFRHWPRWRAEWRVIGPRKNYGLVSDYQPTGQAAESPA